MHRTLVIGDIHGGYKALLQVFERAKVTTQDKLIFLGDYVDGWSQSAEVIEYLLELDKSHSCVFIKGNHDVWCQDWLKTNLPDRRWLIHGGAAAVESYFANKKIDRHKHLSFLNKMPFYAVDSQNNLYIHAGFTSVEGPKKEFNVNIYNWDRTLWEDALDFEEGLNQDVLQYPERMQLFNEIFIGHTPTINYNKDTPMLAGNVWNIDTGTAFTGKLTVLDVQSKAYWQSDKVMDLYPNEKGRN